MIPRLMTAADFTPMTQGLVFDGATHRYTFGGLALPSVTHILKRVGVSRRWDDIPREILEAKRLLGQAVHVAAHYYDEGTLDPQTLDPRVEPYLQAWIDFRDRTGFTPALLETPLQHPGLLIAGTIDRAGYFAKFADADPADLHTVDLKCGDPEDAGARWQTAAYAELLSVSLAPTSSFHQPLKLRMLPRYSVQLLATGKFKLHAYRETLQDWLEFSHFVTTFRRQHLSIEQQEVAA